MKATILCYHKAAPGSDEGRRLNVEPERLKSHVRFYARRARKFVTARDFAGDVSAGSVCFTFDDAYLSTLRYAPEILDRFRVKGTFYAVASMIGTWSWWDGTAARPLASIESLIEANKEGHEIGNHSATHPHLANLDLEDQKKEILSAHMMLKEMGLEPASFCYPYGSYDVRTIDVLKQAGYKVAVSLIKGPVVESSDLLQLPRVVIGFSDALPMLLYKTTLRPKLRKIGA